MPQSENSASPSTYTNNVDDITNYLLFLAGSTGEKEVFTYALMDSESESVISGYGVRHGKIKDMLSDLDAVPGATLHVCLNRTNGKGRKTDDIEAVRVLCVDLDVETTISELKAIIAEHNPAMVVESSPGRYHLYWKVGTEMSKAAWKGFQLGLAFRLGGDMALSQLTHTIRVPGIWRKRELVPYLPKVVLLQNDYKELSEVDVALLWVDMALFQESARSQLKNQKKIERKSATSLSLGKPISIKSGNRNSVMLGTLVEYCKKCQIRVPEVALFQKSAILNGSFTKGPLPQREVEGIVKKVLKMNAAYEDEREKRVDSVSVPVTQELTQNGAHVNGNGNHGGEPRNRDRDRFNEQGLFTRVTEDYAKQLIKKDKCVYAFDSDSFTWHPQDKMPDLIADFVRNCRFELVSDPEFGSNLIDLNSDKAPAQLQRLRDSMMKASVTNGITRSVQGGEGVRTLLNGGFDTDPDLLFVANGVLNLKSLELRTARSEDYLLHRSTAQWEGLAVEAPRWERFVKEIFSENEEPEKMGAFLQEVFGYSLTGSIDSQLVFVHVGGGSNGKSKVLETLAALMGSYCSRMSPENITKGKKSFAKELERIAPQIEGRRVMLVDDLETESSWNDTLIKNLTAPVIAARKLYHEQAPIVNRAKFHFGCNSAPQPESPSEAVIRRLKIIPYRRFFEQSEAAEKELRAMQEGELSGILAWAVEGYQRFVSRGYKFDFPDEVQLEVAQYRKEHFKIEGLVRELFETTGWSRDGGMPLPDIVQEVRRVATERGVYETVSDRKIALILKHQLGAQFERRQANKDRTMIYFVSIKNPLA